IWPVAVVAALIVGSVSSVRLAAFAVFLLAYFAGYPGIQFHERHYFYLEIVPLLAVAYLAGQVPRAIAWRRHAGPDGPRARAALGRAASFSLVVAAAAVAPLAALRAYQERELRAAFTDRLAAPRAPVSVTEQSAGPGRVLLEAETLPAERTAAATIGAVV